MNYNVFEEDGGRLWYLGTVASTEEAENAFKGLREEDPDGSVREVFATEVYKDNDQEGAFHLDVFIRQFEPGAESAGYGYSYHESYSLRPVTPFNPSL